MLILTRKKGGKIVIGSGLNAITITVLEIRGGRVRLGVTAPPEVSIRRAGGGGEPDAPPPAPAAPTPAPEAPVAG